jgi:peptidylprolyl isomerase
MLGVKFGDTVKVHYTGRLDNGKVFDNTDDKGPLTFMLGDGMVIPGFEQALVGMKPGEEKTVKISALRAYGPYLKELVVEVGKDKFVDDIDPEVGQRLQINQPDGKKFMVTVADISDSNVILDANHPLAGKDLTFDIHLIEIIEK